MKLNRIIFSYLAVFSMLFLLSCTSTSPSPSINTKTDLSITYSELNDASSKTILVAAHRGAHIGNFENSIESIHRAIELGVDIVELDVQTTKDGYLVLMHDSHINRTTTGEGKVEDLTFAELRTYKLTGDYGSVSEETIPTFEEALNEIKGKIMFDIDMKTNNAKGVVEAVEKTGTMNDVIFFSNKNPILDDIRKLNASTQVMPRAYSYEMAEEAVVKYAPAIVHISPSFYTKELTKMLRENNARVWINSLGMNDARIRYGDRENVLENLIESGANVIQTDEPEILLQLLRSKGLHH